MGYFAHLFKVRVFLHVCDAGPPLESCHQQMTGLLQLHLTVDQPRIQLVGCRLSVFVFDCIEEPQKLVNRCSTISGPDQAPLCDSP
jgi:hypothetical protein